MTTYKVERTAETIVASTQHVLIAGESGSGKSVLLNNIINSILVRKWEDHAMVLIDPKKTELFYYENTVNCAAYADEIADIERLLERCVDIMERRCREMKERRERTYTGTRVHIIIDELADLAFTSKKAMGFIQRLAQMGRAEGIQLIVATQCPLAQVIPTRIKVNMGLRVGLHTACRQDSRNILDVAGCEELRIGEGLLRDRDGVRKVTIRKVTEEQLNELTGIRERA